MLLYSRTTDYNIVPDTIEKKWESRDVAGEEVAPMPSLAVGIVGRTRAPGQVHAVDVGRVAEHAQSGAGVEWEHSPHWARTGMGAAAAA